MGHFRRRRGLPRDPHWIEAKYDGRCGSPTCTNQVRRGDRVFFYPLSSTAYCTACSPGVAARAAGEIADEEFMCGR